MLILGSKSLSSAHPHDVTDRLFVVRRAFRLNDALPDETNTMPRWKWEIGGWLLVDRVSGHVSQLVLPDFDFENSIASWYRDYVAYCGISNDGKKMYALVEQLGRRKPVLRRLSRLPADVATAASPRDLRYCRRSESIQR
jgi:hypothetical protein